MKLREPIPIVRVSVYVPGDLKARIIGRSERSNVSVNFTVVYYLLHRFQPVGYTDMAADLKARAARRNVPATALNDGSPEPLIISLPTSLRSKIYETARQNFRSLSAEVAHALTEEYERVTP
ncbi:MAG TPA: hypothetical protein VKT80_18255 [Chloroflexota bacterium]|nr:hypothetical protein [Chloroflexota bacterium]